MSNQSTFVSGVMGGVGGFGMGILGNLLASYIQQDWMENQFTSFGVGLLVGMTMMGIVVGAWWHSRHASPIAPSVVPQKVKMKDVEAEGESKIKTKGDGIDLEGVKTKGSSSIEIET